jgi:hypothetical protein
MATASDRRWYVTVTVGPGRTRDYAIAARSGWAAAWLLRQLQPDAVVVLVREVRR